MAPSRIVLAVDTSAAVSVAVHDGTAVLASRHVHDPRRHAELLVPLIQEVLSDAGVERRDLAAVAVGTGPGPFTGLRVGLVSARTLALALGIDAHGVPSLDALALAVTGAGVLAPGTEFVVATDARRREVYWGRYRAPRDDGDLPDRVSGPSVDRPLDVALDGAPCVGRGAVLHADVLVHSGVRPSAHEVPLDPTAAAVARIAVRQLADGPPRPSDPLYLRRPDAAPPVARKRVTT